MLLGDFSRGRESIPIEVVNANDDENEIAPFHYISSCIAGDGLDSRMLSPSLQDDIASLVQRCYCTECCSFSGGECVCLQRMNCGKTINDLEFPYDELRRLRVILRRQQYSSVPLNPIYECNSFCRCNSGCINRVIQLGIRIPLQIFKTRKKNWGVATKRNILLGEFVCEYVGEVIPTKIAKERQQVYDLHDLNYLMVVREFIQSRQCTLRTNIDCTFYGNVARFINHSCEPNLVPEIVRVDSPIPRIGLFACRDIAQGEEITFDYGGNEENINDRQSTSLSCDESLNSLQADGHSDQFPKDKLEQQREVVRPMKVCHCDSGPRCRGFLPFNANV